MYTRTSSKNARVVPGAILIAASVLLLVACATEVAPTASLSPSPSQKVRQLTEEEMHANIMTHDTAFARLINANAQNIAASRALLAAAATNNEVDLEAAVTTGGSWDYVTWASIDELQGEAFWNAETHVLSGFARRKWVASSGYYTKQALGNYEIQRFNDTCGGSIFEQYKQRCTVGDAYLDVECYYVNGWINVTSQHQVTWKFVADPIKRSAKGARCHAESSSGGDGSDCGSHVDPIDGSGGCDSEPTVVDVAPNEPAGSDWSNLCVDMVLDPGCYDIYVDGDYDSTICC